MVCITDGVAVVSLVSSHDRFLLTFIARKYRSAYRELFSIVNANDDKHLNMATTSGCASDYYRFGWLLFLALRVHVFRPCKTLVSCTHGLFSVLVSRLYCFIL